MSLSTLHRQGCDIVSRKSEGSHLTHSDGPYDVSNILSPMARGYLIECLAPETIDNNSSKKESLEQRPGASAPVIENMKSELNRLKSFTNRWPLSYVQPKELASVGLFYLGQSDNVQCAFCHGIISDWEVGDKPLNEHVRHFPMCPFLLNCKVGNIPLSGENGKQSWQVQSSRAECCSHSEPISEPQSNVQSFRPRHPSMGSFDKRLETYIHWPSTSPMKPMQLAEAGLFYSTDSDVVTCFCCGGSLGNWSPGDDAWAEHAKFFPNCSYVQCIKGSLFSERVQQSRSHAAENCATELQNEPMKPESMPVHTKAPDVNREEQSSASAEKEPSNSSGGKAKFTCKICMEEETRVVFVPCGHSLACPKCASNLSTCPMCRKHIDSSVTSYKLCNFIERRNSFMKLSTYFFILIEGSL